MSLRFLRCLMVAFSFCAFFMTLISAHADTYTASYVMNDNRGQFLSADDAGNYIVALHDSIACHTYTQDCFATYSAYDNSTTYTTFTPRLQENFSPIAGRGCTMDRSLFISIFSSACNNGYEFIAGTYNGNYGVFTGAGTDLQFLFGGTMDGRVIITPNGNLFFDDGLHDELMALTNRTTAIAAQPISFATPEPSSLVLLATGSLGVIGAARRKLFA